VIFVDSNVPMYLVGGPHPQKADAQRLLEKLVSERERLVTSVEVPQEILHRYVAIDRRDAIQPAFDALLGVVDEVLAIEHRAVERAKTIIMAHRDLSARDALHLAVMQQHGVAQIVSFDVGFDLTVSPDSCGCHSLIARLTEADLRYLGDRSSLQRLRDIHDARVGLRQGIAAAKIAGEPPRTAPALPSPAIGRS
jgi:predicted nucleic acid-binding protein